MRRLLIALLIALLPASASAQMLLLGVDRGAAISYVGPGDVVAGATAFWGLRAYSAAIVAGGTQPLVNLRRSSDSHSCDVRVSASGGMGVTANCSTGGDNGSAAATWCNATSCFAVTFYDQSGNANDLTQATAANQPLLVFNCLGSLPCLRGNGTSQYMSKGSGSTIAPLSFSGVIQPSGSTLGVPFSNLSSGTTNWTGNYMTWNGGTPTITASAALNNTFATGSTTAGTLAAGAAGSIGGTWASSTSRTAYLNGTAATADTSSVAASGQDQLALWASVKQPGSVSNWFTGDIMEGMVYSSALSAGNHSALCHNQFTYWGTATSC